MRGKNDKSDGAGEGRTTRLAAVGAVILVGAFAMFSVFGGDEPYTLTLRADNAGQLVNGNEVKVGGVPIGTVKGLSLADDGAAEIEIEISDDELTPMHDGTTAQVQFGSLSGVANRVVSLTPGPNNADELPSGATIDQVHVTSPVEIDTVLNTLDASTRSALQRTFHGFAGTLDGAEAAANRGLRALSPALTQTSLTMREIGADDRALERLIVRSSAVVGALSPRRTEIEEGIAASADVASQIAAENQSLATLLEEGPDTLRLANTTMVNLRATFGDLRPTLDLAQPVGERLAPVLTLLGPVARNSRPTLARLRTILPDLDRTLAGFPPLADAALPAFDSTTGAIDDALPIVSGARPYFADILQGPTGGFGGEVGGYYDANGSYVRLSLNAGLQTTIGAPTFPGAIPEPFIGNTQRCPGGGTQSAPDGSNPFVEGAPCDPAQSPP